MSALASCTGCLYSFPRTRLISLPHLDTPSRLDDIEFKPLVSLESPREDIDSETLAHAGLGRMSKQSQIGSFGGTGRAGCRGRAR